MTFGWPCMTFNPSNKLHLVTGPSDKFSWWLCISKHFLTSGWSQMTPAWPLTPVVHYALVRGSSNQIGSHRVFLRQVDLWMTIDLRWGRFENMPTDLRGPSPYHAKFKLNPSNHNEDSAENMLNNSLGCSSPDLSQQILF